MKRKFFNRKKKFFKRAKIATKKYVNVRLARAIETKYIDTVIDLNPDQSYSMTRLTTTSQGSSDAGQRIGDKIKLRKLFFNLEFNAADTTNQFRMIVFQWKVNSAYRTPQDGDILSHVTTALDHLHSHFDWDNRAQFKVIYNKTLSVCANSPTAARNLKKKINLKGKSIEYISGGSDAINHIYMFIVSDSGAAPHPTIKGYYRVTYKDA